MVQVYLERPESAEDRPVRWLAGYAGTHLAPGGTESVDVRIPASSFAHYDGGWQFERVAFRILVGRHSADDFHALEIELGKSASSDWWRHLRVGVGKVHHASARAGNYQPGHLRAHL